ncbi:hypothetical protein [Streptomyces sp. TRM64462]|uniref:hypothetical protein n=1 Tax=Streptomyces sp. TRM64462 TaxID=2741726 RepID=UPI001586BC68|nr:hypothetical protein [Streptomyces sp. TRM64462]
MGEERGARAARARALAVLRVRGRALAVALLPAAVAVVLLTGGVTGQLAGPGWDVARWVVSGLALAVLLGAAAVGAVIARARPALTPTVEIAETSAPDLYRMVRDLAARLAVPAPSAIALTPDCDSWLEDRTHPAHRISGAADSGRRSAGGTGGAGGAAPVLVIGSPFLWWMRVGELRAVLAPVVAGTGPSAHPDIAAARRFVRGLDAAVALPDRPGLGAIRRLAARGTGAVARLMLRAARGHAAEMERGVAAAASERAQAVDYGLRIVAQEQVGLAYAGWDRLLTRVALPAWRMGRWPSRLDAGVVAALTELSRRDRLAEGFTSRLGERPACDLLEEPGLVDEATSLLAARLFHGGPAEPGPDWAPVDWQQYPEEVVDRKWRTEAARLHRALDRLGVRRDTASDAPTLARVVDHLAASHGTETLAAAITAEVAREEAAREEAHRRAGAAARASGTAGTPGASHTPGASGTPQAVGTPDVRVADELPLVPLQPPRTGRDLLADHVTAMVCCAAVDTAGAAPGLDWLDGPTLLLSPPQTPAPQTSAPEAPASEPAHPVHPAETTTGPEATGSGRPEGAPGMGSGRRRADVAAGVLALIEDADPEPLRHWLAAIGVRPEKPIRLV